MKRFALVSALTLASWTSVAFADEAPPPVADQPATVAPATPPRTDLWHIGVGTRIDYVTSTGFDQFADTNALGSFVVDGTYPLLHRGKLALGVGASWSFGARSDSLRGDKAQLVVHRLQVPIEGRYHFLPQVYAFAKVAPGAAASLASLKDASSPNEVKDTAWSFAADASVGAGILIGPRSYDHEDKRTIRFWAVPEVGYGFATKASFDARPDRDAKDALGTDERTALRALNLSAFFWRVSIATTF